MQLLQIFPSDVMHFNMQAVVSLAVFTALNSCRRYKRIFLEVGKYICVYHVYICRWIGQNKYIFKMHIKCL